MKKIIINISFLFCLMPCSVAFAIERLARNTVARRSVIVPGVSNKSGGFGDIAQNLFGAAEDIHKMIKTLAIACGVTLILFSFMQYKKHRKNPIETPLSRAITTFVIGLALIGLSFVPLQV